MVYHVVPKYYNADAHIRRTVEAVAVEEFFASGEANTARFGK